MGSAAEHQGEWYFSLSRDLVIQLFMRSLWIPGEKDHALLACLERFLLLVEAAGLAPEQANSRWAGQILMNLVSQSPSAWFDRPFGFACFESGATGPLVGRFYAKLIKLENAELQKGYRRRCPDCQRSYPVAAVVKHQRNCRVRHAALRISIDCLHQQEKQRMLVLKRRLDTAADGVVHADWLTSVL